MGRPVGGELAVGVVAKIMNFRRRSDLNGKFVVLKKFGNECGRWAVAELWSSKLPMSRSPMNLESLT